MNKSCETSNLLKIVFVATFTILIFIPAALAQDNRQQETPPSVATDLHARVLVLSSKVAEEQKKKLANAIESPIRIDNTDGAPVTVSEAKVKGARLAEVPAGGSGASGAASSTMIIIYFMQAKIKVSNTSDRRTTGIGLQFTNAETKRKFYILRFPLSIDPKKDYEIESVFCGESGEPARLAVQVVTVRFEDKSTWGSDPFPPPRANSSQADGVDIKPSMLNIVRPEYTEKARRNKTQGVVLAFTSIGADGSVKQVEILHGLPDGLNEEAIRALYRTRFRPAMKNGQPVAYWVTMQVDFNLR